MAKQLTNGVHRMVAGSANAKRRIFLGVPFYDRIEGQTVVSWDRALRPDSPSRVERGLTGSSVLCDNFNQLWCAALNQRPRPDYFTMCHADVVPLIPGWLDMLADECDRARADWLSVAMPIKDDRGLTSTAVEHRVTGRYRRLTMAEVLAARTPTFDAAGAGYPEHRLLASTGLWIMDLRKPWLSNESIIRNRLFFESPTKLIEVDGKLMPLCCTEDWVFARHMHALGLKVLSTRIIPALHIGPFEYANDENWGSADEDVESDPVSWVDEPRTGGIYLGPGTRIEVGEGAEVKLGA